MRVCLYSHAYPPSIGGIETVSVLLAEHLSRRGVEVTVATQTSSNGKEEASPYRIVRKPSWTALRRLVASHDLAHCNAMSVRGAIAAFRCGVPLVVTHQGCNAAIPRSFGELRRMVEREGARRPAHAVVSALGMHLARANVCISRFLYERLSPPRGAVIYNPISQIFRPLPQANLADRFAFVGRLVTDKGCEVLLRALTECARRGYSFGLDIYGEGPEKQKLEAVARECGVSGQVSFPGCVTGESLVRAYNGSLAVVVPSVWEEPLGIVALEAMACGRAVIASAVGGLGEIVNGVGLTFPNGDVKALADCMIRLAENPALRQELAHRGALHADRFRIDSIGDVYLDLYRSVLDETAPQIRPGQAPQANRRRRWGTAA